MQNNQQVVLGLGGPSVMNFCDFSCMLRKQLTLLVLFVCFAKMIFVDLFVYICCLVHRN